MTDVDLQTQLYKKVDITDKVTGKMNGPKMNLYLNDRVIGAVHFGGDQPQFELYEGYGLEEDLRLYQIQVPGETMDHYVEGCDLGWC